MAKYTVINVPKTAAIIAAADQAGFDVAKVTTAFIEVLTSEQKDFTDEIITEFTDMVTQFKNAPVSTAVKAGIWYGGTLLIFKTLGQFFPQKSITVGKIRIKLF